MRTEEVEEAINKTEQLKQFIKEKGKDFCFYDNENAVIGYECLNVVLNYIVKLEEDIELIYKVKIENRNRLLDNSIPKQVIRDKIKEIESNGIWITEDYYFSIELEDEYPICQTKFDKEEMEDIVKDILKEILGE